MEIINNPLSCESYLYFSGDACFGPDSQSYPDRLQSTASENQSAGFPKKKPNGRTGEHAAISGEV
ncbi:MAG: hypothetical protein RBT80_21820 [Candidatus Vecturithrix sp.]|nr:hypothetical protein [Candidatus Vecturithrix sp.]